MSDPSPSSSFHQNAAQTLHLPDLEIEVRNGSSRPLLYTVTETAFLVGSVAGCDLRLPGLDLPPMVCLIARKNDGIEVRKLVPSISMAVNGEPCTLAQLSSGDIIRIGTVDLVVRHSGTSKPEPESDDALDIQKVRRESAVLRRQLYDRYRHRRDRLAGLQESVSRAATKVQERKRELDAAVEAFETDRTKIRSEAEMSAKREQQLLAENQTLRSETDRDKLKMEEERRAIDARHKTLDARSAQLEETTNALEKQRKQYEADLIRLDRQRADVESLKTELADRTAELEQRFARLEHDSEELEKQARLLDQTRGEVSIENQLFAKQRQELESLQVSLRERVSSVEQQQLMLAQLRTRLEREREMVRLDDQRLAEQRTRQEQTEAEQHQRVREFERRSAEFEAKRHAREEEERTFQARLAVVEEAELRFRTEHERVAAAAENVRQQVAAVERRAADLERQSAELKEQMSQLAESQERLAVERLLFREREAVIAQAEAARETLQEQLRRRADELTERQQTLNDREQAHQRAVADLEQLREGVRAEREQGDAKHATRSQELARHASELSAREAAIAQRENTLRRHVERLKRSGRSVGAARKSLRDEMRLFETARKEAEAETGESRRTLQSLHESARELIHRVSQWETVARAADEHVARAREQIRGHLVELHTYARQAQEDAETLRSQVQSEADHVRQQTAALHRGRDEHRLAVAAFRQHLIDWQGKVAEMKRAFSQGEIRLEQQQVEMDEISARLTRQSEQLDAQQRAVSERREVVDRQLTDMREWYRQKLRELSERFDGDSIGPHVPAAALSTEPDDDDSEPTILTMTAPVDPGDRKLGDLLRSNDLVESTTLAALLLEARKQRRSLRQVLLASGTLTLYQLALIEAGNLDGLMLGPVRIMDRLRVAARETVYRVYDPRRTAVGIEGYAVLRHLSEAEMEDAVHPDEFRQRFSAVVSLQHPHIATTFEVLEIQSRPAALQEWIGGLAATDWPTVFAVAGVGFRLLSQAALGLHTAHEAGIIHGHLHSSLLMLTGDGTLKVCGFGEPAWLAAPDTLPKEPATDADPHHDLMTLGRIASAWLPSSAPQRRRFKSKKASDPLHAIVERLVSPTPKRRYPDAAALLEELDGIGVEVEPNPEAWDQLLRYVRENSGTEPAWRQSA